MAELRMTHRHATEDELQQLRHNGFAAWVLSYRRSITQINPRGRVDGTSDNEPLQPDSTSNLSAVEDLTDVELVENFTEFGLDAVVHSEYEAEVGEFDENSEDSDDSD
uniref:Uncharacterized protein n=1 Tax=Brassica oleracea var. oleracea TaxID=109376 RepID=A0A0D3BCW5_BRAOL